ncbi:hypothetical protein SAMN05421810_10157 [Amycolatopsis arida]|uniref:Uncharacterized protein n=1 Tax=Amycolatopsis arida TaxID=587909 RepID=A0A1I5K9W3_9PSEU|nr:hypothetical protein CLV69_10255 [Amycolatopsis arida]SFO81809.1 hypothetical protein SAMN05421810_10157 [Amycolatopsis arida]
MRGGDGDWVLALLPEPAGKDLRNSHRAVVTTPAADRYVHSARPVKSLRASDVRPQREENPVEPGFGVLMVEQVLLNRSV